MYKLIRSYDVEVNILFANMTEIEETTLGKVIIQVKGETTEVDKALFFLKNSGVGVEEVEKHDVNYSFN
ncbi:DL-methionine transporter ATP-binding subunit [compost metagenome]